MTKTLYDILFFLAAIGALSWGTYLLAIGFAL